MAQPWFVVKESVFDDARPADVQMPAQEAKLVEKDIKVQTKESDNLKRTKAHVTKGSTNDP